MLLLYTYHWSVGMSEVTGPAITNIIKPGQFKIGSVGKALTGVEVKLDYTATTEEGQGEVRNTLFL